MGTNPRGWIIDVDSVNKYKTNTPSKNKTSASQKKPVEVNPHDQRIAAFCGILEEVGRRISQVDLCTLIQKKTGLKMHVTRPLLIKYAGLYWNREIVSVHEVLYSSLTTKQSDEKPEHAHKKVLSPKYDIIVPVSDKNTIEINKEVYIKLSDVTRVIDFANKLVEELTADIKKVRYSSPSVKIREINTIKRLGGINFVGLVLDGFKHELEPGTNIKLIIED